VIVSIDPQDVKRLREETGAGVMDCKRALQEAKGDYAAARGILQRKGFERAAEKAERAATDGVVEAYVHSNGRRGALIELNSETDFVARNPEFRRLAKELAMQIAAMEPGDVDELLAQAYIRDQSKTVRELVTTLAAKVGENVKVGRFAHFKLGG
jgi:elongation factor Ts